MNKINIFLAFFIELKADRGQFEKRIHRKCKALIDKGIFLHLNIWEDLSTWMFDTRSQDEYNKTIAESDLLVSLASSKVGMYIMEEFDQSLRYVRINQETFYFT